VQGTELAVPADLVRLSVGVEDLTDLRADLAAALAAAQEAAGERVLSGT
jgi:cystathionine gamma-synthase